MTALLLTLTCTMASAAWRRSLTSGSAAAVRDCRRPDSPARAMKAGARGSSLMQPTTAEGAGRPALGPASLAAVAEADVEPSDVFFHKYFALAARTGAKASKEKARKEGDESSDSEADIGALGSPCCRSRVSEVPASE